jgi:hypothetical protein
MFPSSKEIKVSKFHDKHKAKKTNASIIMETDAAAIAARVTKRSDEGDNVPLQDQTISQVWKSAQEQLARSFLK